MAPAFFVERRRRLRKAMLSIRPQSLYLYHEHFLPLPCPLTSDRNHSAEDDSAVSTAASILAALRRRSRCTNLRAVYPAGGIGGWRVGKRIVQPCGRVLDGLQVLTSAFGIGCFFPGRKSCECVIRGWMKLIRSRQRWLGRDSSQTLSCIKLSSYDIPWSGYGQFLKSFLEEKFDSEIRVWVWSTLHKRLKTTFSRRIIYYILYMSYWKNTLLQMASVEETALAWFGFETNKLFA